MIIWESKLVNGCKAQEQNYFFQEGLEIEKVIGKRNFKDGKNNSFKFFIKNIKLKINKK